MALVVELDERVGEAGQVLQPLDEGEVRRRLSGLRDRGIRSLAVCLMNSYRNDAHEQLVEKVALQLGFEQVSVSARLSPLQKIVSRGDTTVVDAYLTPIIRDYVQGIAALKSDPSQVVFAAITPVRGTGLEPARPRDTGT